MDSNKLVSLIIPVRNGEKTLEQCLDCIVRQDCENYEIVIIDNGSTDRTKEIINTFAQHFSNISYVFESKLGRGQARNAGVAAANGEVIAMTDVDCLVEKDWLSRLTGPILNNEAIATSGFEKDAIGNYWSRMRQAEDWRFIQEKIKGNHIDHLDTKNFAIRADVLKRLRFDPELVAFEDWDLFIRLKLEGIPINFIENLLVAHYHDSSVKDLVDTQFVRGENACMVISKYRYDVDFIKVFGRGEIVNFFSVYNFLVFIPWAIWQFMRHPFIAPYRVLADLSWKLGVLNFRLKKLLKIY